MKASLKIIPFILLLAGCLQYQQPGSDHSNKMNMSEGRETVAALTPVAEVAPLIKDDMFSAYAKGALYAGAGEYSRAAEALMNSAQMHADSALVRIRLAGMQVQTGNITQAIRNLEDALMIEPGNLLVLKFLASIHEERGNRAELEKYLTSVVAIDPDSIDATVRLAYLLAERNESEQALKLLETFSGKFPTEPSAWYARAKIYQNMGLTLRATESYEKVLSIDPTSSQVAIDYGDLLVQKGDDDAALLLYQRVLNANPDDIIVRHHLGSLYAARNQYELSLAEFDIILNSRPDDLDAVRKRGLVLLELGAYDEVIVIFKRLVAQVTDYDQGYYYLGRAFALKGELTEALQAYKKVPSHSAIYPETTIQRATIHLQKKQYQETILLLQELESANKMIPEFYIFWSGVVAAQGESDPLAPLEAGLERTPLNPELLYRKGLLFDQRGEKAEAQQLIEKALAESPNHAESLNYLAYSYAEEGIKLKRARAMAELALKIKDAPHIVDTLGWVLFKLGEYHDATVLLEKAAVLLPDDPTVNEHLGDVYRVTGKRQKALTIYRKVLKVNPDLIRIERKIRLLGH